LKLDNIMKRITADKIKYFVIDFDTISRQPKKGIVHSVDRRAYSPIWASQVAAFGVQPTSYRYDLQELFFAVSDLVKQKRAMPLFDDRKSADQLMKEGFDVDTIRKYTQSSFISGDGDLTALFRMIMDQPERLPFLHIDHTPLIEYVERIMPDVKSTTKPGTCVVCERFTDTPISTVDEENNAIAVCTISCAGIANDKLHGHEARNYDKMTRKVIAQPSCAQCSAPASARCDKCSFYYCSSKCQTENWTEHRSYCQ